MRNPLHLSLAAALAALWLAMLVGGGGPVDRAVLLGVYSADLPALAATAVGFTYAGNGNSLIAITIAAAAWLLYQGRAKAALLLLFATLTGRILVVLQKLWFARLRPEENLRLVEVSSLSFPSGHAANSAMVFVALALLLPPDRRRKQAVWGAAALALLIGLSRPMLGVHWPSDVVAGWAFGALWLWLCWTVGAPLVDRKPLFTTRSSDSEEDISSKSENP